MATATQGFDLWHLCPGKGDPVRRAQVHRAGRRLWEQQPIHRRIIETWFHSCGGRCLGADDRSGEAAAPELDLLCRVYLQLVTPPEI